MTKAGIVNELRKERDRYEEASKEFATGKHGYFDYVNAEACKQRALALGLIITRIELDEKKK